MAGEAKVTTDHEVIRKWAEEREGRPASVGETGGKGGAGLLRIDLSGKKRQWHLASNFLGRFLSEI